MTETTQKIADAAYAAGLAAGVPEGWKLVPVEPTPEMIGAMACEEATGKINHEPTVGMAGAENAYAAMIAAAPEPKP